MKYDNGYKLGVFCDNWTIFLDIHLDTKILGWSKGIHKKIQIKLRVLERSGLVVECLTGDKGATGLSLTGVTVLCF